jgi:ribosome recycling factor
MDVLSAESNGHTNSSDWMQVARVKVEENPPIAIKRFDGLQLINLCFAIRRSQLSRMAHQNIPRVLIWR